MNRKILVFFVAIVMAVTALSVFTSDPDGSFSSTVASQNPALSGTMINIIINSDGTTNAPTSVISQMSTGNGYIMHENVIGNITDHWNSSSFNGNGYTLYGDMSTTMQLSNLSSFAVTNLTIHGFKLAIDANNTSGLTIDNVTLVGSLPLVNVFGFNVTNSTNVALLHNNLSKVTTAFSFENDNGIASSWNQVSNSGNRSGAFSYNESRNVSSGHDSVANTTGWSIYARHGENFQFQDDNFNNSTWGNYFADSSQISILHSDLSNITSGDALWIGNSTHINVSYDKFYDPSAVTHVIYLQDDPDDAFFSGDFVYAPSDQAINLHTCYGVTLLNSVVTAEYAIDSWYSTSLTVIENDTISISNGYEAILLYADYTGGYNSNILVEGNHVVGTSGGTGVEMGSDYSANVTIVKNVFMNLDVAMGLFVNTGDGYLVANNTIQGCGDAVYWNTIENITVEGNAINGSSGDAIEGDTFNAHIFGNKITNTGSYAIEIDWSGGVLEIYSNLISNVTNGAGIYVCGLTADIYNNTLDNLEYGIYIENSAGINVFDNTIYNTTSTGIYDSQDYRLNLYDNRVTNSTTSFYSFQSSSDSVYANTFQNSSHLMLDLEMDSNFTLYHNNFMNQSKVQMQILDCIGIKWNLSLPVGGNYWSNYTFADKGNEGIGPEPYNITHSNVDQLPLTIQWHAYTVVFEETGLAAGTSWSVDIYYAGLETTYSSAGSVISFSPDYAQQITEGYSAQATGYATPAQSGTISLSGSDIRVYVTFPPVKYSMTLTESGLYNGTNWTATVGEVSQTTNGTSLTFEETNGTYDYSVTVEDSIYWQKGIAIVNGSSCTITLAFPKLVTLNVIETGLSSGTSWTFVINGTGFTTIESSMHILVARGSYNVSAVGPVAYHVTLQSSKVSANSTNLSIEVTFSQSAQTGGGSDLGLGLAIGAVIGAATGIVVLATLLYLGTVSIRRRGMK